MSSKVEIQIMIPLTPEEYASVVNGHHTTIAYDIYESCGRGWEPNKVRITNGNMNCDYDALGYEFGPITGRALIPASVRIDGETDYMCVVLATEESIRRYHEMMKRFHEEETKYQSSLSGDK